MSHSESHLDLKGRTIDQKGSLNQNWELSKKIDRSMSLLFLPYSITRFETIAFSSWLDILRVGVTQGMSTVQL